MFSNFGIFYALHVEWVGLGKGLWKVFENSLNFHLRKEQPPCSKLESRGALCLNAQNDRIASQTSVELGGSRRARQNLNVLRRIGIARPSARTAFASVVERRSSNLRLRIVDVETAVHSYHSTRRVERLLSTIHSRSQCQTITAVS